MSIYSNGQIDSVKIVTVNSIWKSSRGKDKKHLESITKYKFGSNGNLLTIQVMGKKEMVKNVEKDGTIQIRHRIDYDTPKSETIYRYNSDNKLENEISYLFEDNGNPTVNKFVIHEYIDNSERILTYNKDSLLQFTQSIYYDSLNRIILKIDSSIFMKYLPEGIKVESFIYEYDSSNREIASTISVNNELKEKVVTEYPDSSTKLIIKFIFLEGNWKMKSTTRENQIEITKNRACNRKKTKIESCLQNDSTLFCSTVEYRYDKYCRVTGKTTKVNGNAVEQTSITFQ